MKVGAQKCVTQRVRNSAGSITSRGLKPPVPQEPLAWAPMESGEDALRRVREHGDRQSTGTE